jgi:cbb3-type cytochrome oxidase maturation protein
LSVTILLFLAGTFMGLGGALIFAWAVHSGQLRNLERTKEQLFWPDLAPDDDLPPAPGQTARKP